MVERFKPVPEKPAETGRRFLEWCEYYFGDPKFPRHYRIRVQFAPMHYRIAEVLSIWKQYTLITAPRGFAKTTIVAILWTIYLIVHNLEAFIVIVGKNDKAARKNLRTIRNELATNV